MFFLAGAFETFDQALSALSFQASTSSPRIWHDRLGHVGVEVIDQVRNKEGVQVDDGRGPLTHECETCAVSKAKPIISRKPLSEATKPCQVLHYDLIAEDTGFGGSKVFAHFTCPVLKMNWGFPLQSRVESEQIRCVKYMVKMVERVYDFIVEVIHSDNESGIGTKSQNWVKELGVRFEWSATETPAQNGIAERNGHLLTIKARCIRVMANLPEDMWPECYLAFVYLEPKQCV